MQRGWRIILVMYVRNPCDAKELANKGLDEFVEAIKSLRVKYFLSAGTCLGFVRDGGYIKGDYDLDFIIDCTEEQFQKLTEALIACGFQTPIDCIDHHKFCKYNIVYDVFQKKVYQKKELRGYLKFLEAPQRITYNGKEYNVPSPVEEYLEFKYGNWIIRT